MTDPDIPLWVENERSYGESELEAQVRVTIEAIHAETPLTPAQRAIARVCRALAKNIDAGNTKGRAIANEAAQLERMLNQIAGVDHAENESPVDRHIKELMDAFAHPAAAGADPAPARHNGS